jgi:hypothetical protein
MATISPTISPAEIELRRRGIGSVIGTMAAEGEAIPSDLKSSRGEGVTKFVQEELRAVGSICPTIAVPTDAGTAVEAGPAYYRLRLQLMIGVR